MTLPVALVLAAGRGTRFGGPKVLAPWACGDRSRALGLAHVEARARDSRETLLVVRASEVAALEAQGVAANGRLVISEEREEHGAAGSLARGLAALEPRFEGWVLVTPVDVPPARTDVVAALVAAATTGRTVLAVRPTHGGRGGHPVLVRVNVLRRAYASDRPPLREVLRGLDVMLVDVEVSDAEVLLDFDTREALVAHVTCGARQA